MKTVFLNKPQTKLFLIFTLIFFFLPLGGMDGQYTQRHTNYSFYELGFPFVVWNIGKPIDWGVFGLTGVFQLLLAYFFSHMASFVITTFRSWHGSKIIRKVVGIIFMMFFVALFMLMILNIYVRIFIFPNVPFMPSGPLRINLDIVQSVNAQILAFQQDLAHLRNQDQNLTRAYDKISVQSAWDLINGTNKQLQPVIIGIFDTGLDKSHLEFENVKSGASHGINLRDPDGHGTAVAGIIGANNILGNGGTLPTNSPQINGIVSGVLNIDYILEARAFVSTQKIPKIVRIIPQELLGLPPATIVSFGTFIEEFDSLNVQIINMSFASPKCSAMPVTVRAAYFLLDRGCASDNDFLELSQMYEEVIKMHSSMLFVASAGNESMDTAFSTPSNVESDNIITVAATDLDDKRADFDIGSSNFGSVVDVATPGKSVYAPTARGKGELGNRDYTFFGGTSAAAPLVTGVAAILKALEPEYQKHTPDLVVTPAKIKEILQPSADPIVTDKPMGSGCFDPNNNPQGYNGCRMNAFRVVNWLLPPTPVILDTPIVAPVP